MERAGTETEAVAEAEMAAATAARGEAGEAAAAAREAAGEAAGAEGGPAGPSSAAPAPAPSALEPPPSSATPAPAPSTLEPLPSSEDKGAPAGPGPGRGAPLRPLGPIEGGLIEGVMIGRAAYNDPWFTLADVDRLVFGEEKNAAASRREVGGVPGCVCVCVCECGAGG